MSEYNKIVEANARFKEGFNLGHLPMPPGRKFAVVACMDARLNPAAVMGLEIGDAHVIRNAGGLVTDDALRSLVISYKLLGTQEFFIVEHTDCGMLTFTNDVIQEKLKADTGKDATHIDFLPFSDVKANLKKQAEKVRGCELIPGDIPVHGFLYHVETGELEHVVSV